MNELLRRLPQTSVLLDGALGRRLAERYSREEAAWAVREALAAAREALMRGGAAEPPAADDPDVFARMARSIEARRRPSLRPVINATGVIIHTNLGRAPLAPEALAAVRETAGAYANLEMDLVDGARGSRHAHVEALLRTLTGAEAALVVNNGAAAVMVCLTALAAGREVIASRGELIEIGGGFRMPDVIAASGARLREVGATNKTRARDYAGAIGPETAVLLKSHASNFRIVGFTAAPGRRELADLAQAHGLVMMEDLGSGVLIDLAPHGLTGEPTVGQVVAEGAHLVTFSGDKLLGGPQAGVIAGRRDLIARIANHPMVRAMRVDKLSLAALEATLRLYLPPHDPLARIPVLRAITTPVATLLDRARALAADLADPPGLETEGVESEAFVGGGALPQQALASAAIALRPAGISLETLAARLRAGEPAVVGRISGNRLLLDLRTVSEEEIALLAGAVRGALRG